TLLAVGTAGVIAMEQSAIDGNFDARRLDVANSVLRLWTERLRNDGAMWTLPNEKNPSTSNLATTAPLLANVAANPTASTWTLPVEREGDTIPLMPQLDLLGRDVLASDTTTPVVYCVQTRQSWLVVNNLMRVEVRVFWPRGSQAMTDCTSNPANGWESLPTTVSKYHFIYGVTAIRRNPAP
ncbi:MAG TPA: hypothetical protein VF407_24395, partial [Polyangiaceae bacterium]